MRRVSPEHGTLNPDVLLSLVAVGGASPEQFVRLQWRHDDGTGVRVLVPGEDIFPIFLQSRLTAAFMSEATMIDGALIARKVTDPRLDTPEHSFLPPVSATASSQRYPLRLDVSAPGSAIAAANASLFVYANIGGLIFALFAVTIAVLVSRRSVGPIREIALGVRRREFAPYYQPVIDIASGRLVGCEVLVRWVKPDGRVDPAGPVHRARRGERRDLSDDAVADGARARRSRRTLRRALATSSSASTCAPAISTTSGSSTTSSASSAARRSA